MYTEYIGIVLPYSGLTPSKKTPQTLKPKLLNPRNPRSHEGEEPTGSHHQSTCESAGESRKRSKSNQAFTRISLSLSRGLRCLSAAHGYLLPQKLIGFGSGLWNLLFWVLGRGFSDLASLYKECAYHLLSLTQHQTPA